MDHFLLSLIAETMYRTPSGRALLPHSSAGHGAALVGREVEILVSSTLGLVRKRAPRAMRDSSA